MSRCCAWCGPTSVPCELDEDAEPANYEETECCVGSIIDVDDLDSYVRCESCDAFFGIECINSLHRAVVDWTEPASSPPRYQYAVAKCESGELYRCEYFTEKASGSK